MREPNASVVPSTRTGRVGAGAGYYTSHDEDVTVKDFYTMNDWRLYSTADMVNARIGVGESKTATGPFMDPLGSSWPLAGR